MRYRVHVARASPFERETSAGGVRRDVDSSLNKSGERVARRLLSTIKNSRIPCTSARTRTSDSARTHFRGKFAIRILLLGRGAIPHGRGYKYALCA